MKLKKFCLICISLILLGGCTAGRAPEPLEYPAPQIISEKEVEKEPEKQTAPEKSTEASVQPDAESPIPARRMFPSPIGGPTTAPNAEAAMQKELTQKDYFFELLPGEWNGYVGDNDFYLLTISPDLTFTYEYENGLGSGEYSGTIIPKWFWRNENRDVPDQLVFEVEEGSDSAGGGSFALSFRELNSQLNMNLERVKLGTREPEVRETMFNGLIFENGFTLSRWASKVLLTDEPVKNGYFLVKFLGGDYSTNELWLERVEYDVNGKFFVSKKNIAVKYKMLDKSESLWDMDVHFDAYYMITTDFNGEIYYIEAADKDLLERDYFESSVPDIWDILRAEAEEFNKLVAQGFESVISQESTEINGRICYDCLVGTTSQTDPSEKVFDIEARYSVDVVMRKVYKYDSAKDSWAPLN